MFKKLFKFLFKTLLWLIAILLIVATIIYFTASLWIKPVVGYVVPKITKTAASLESADISLFSGRIGLKGLKIANPTGFNEPYVFELGEISVNFQPKSIFTDKIIINQVMIKGTQVVAEYNKDVQMNLMVLNENVHSSLNQGKTEKVPAQPTTKTSTSTSSKSVIIKDLQILDTRLRFAVMGQASTLKLPNIQQKNIGEKKKMTLAEGIQYITDELTIEPLKEMTKSTQKALQNAFKTIELHTTNSQAVKELKDSLSGFSFF